MKFCLLIFILLSALSCAKLKDKLEPYHRKDQYFHARWIKNLDPAHESGNLPIGMGSPLVYEGMVFMPDLSGVISCFDLETGRLLWSHQEAEPLGGRSGIHKDQVIYASYSGRVYSRNFRTGEIKYSIDLKSPIESEPYFYQGRMLIHMRNHQLIALDALTGKILWSYKRAIPFSTTLQRVSIPKVINGKIIIGFADGFIGAFSLEEGVLAWEKKLSYGNKFIDVDVAPIMFGSRLVMSAADGPLSFIDPANGQLLLTQDVVPGHTPLIDNNRLIFGTTSGEIVVIDSQGQIQHKIPVSKSGISAMNKWKGSFVISTYSGQLIQLDVKTLAQKEVFELGSEFSAVFGNLVVSDEYLAVYSSRNRLYLFK